MSSLYNLDSSYPCAPAKRVGIEAPDDLPEGNPALEDVQYGGDDDEDY